MQRLQITARGLKLSRKIQEYIDLKVSKVQKLLPTDVRIRCEIIQQKTKIGLNDYLQVEFSLHLPKAYIEVVSEGEDIYSVVDELEDTLKRRVRSYKEKHYDKSKRMKFSDVMLNV